ncbi:MAG: pseudouridine synthase [Hymenobacteraceae bacterium]|nr:pseudouridine synthase [Hymenobacteraceae bacterium]
MARENERPARGNAGAGRSGADRNYSDRPNNDREGKKIFNRRDKYDGSGEERGGRERRSFDADRRDNDRRGYRRDDERRSYGDRREGGERRSFGNDRRSFDGDRPKRYDREGGERRSFNADRPDRREGGERRSFGSDRPRREDDGRRSFGNDRREAGERRSYGEDRPFRRDDRRSGERREGGERRSFNADRPRREDGERRSYGNDRRERDERRSFKTDRPGREEGGRRSFDGDKKPYRENRAERLGKQAPAQERFSDRGRKEDDIQEAPTYNLSRYKDNPRIKKTNRKEEEDGTIRLNRFIANAGICSRREADSLIESGEIKVNGEVVTEMGFKVKPTDNVQYGKKILNRQKLVYVLLNKPKDFITTTDDPEGRKTVMNLVANASTERIFPVGRLDRNTTGLLLFTNDGELAQKLTHPSNNIKKIYQVELDKPITKEDFKKIAEGVELEDGKAEVDDVALLGESNKFLGLEIHIGRNRIVRRIFEHLGYEVVTLDRVQYAGLVKKDVPRGNWRYLTEKEVIRLKYFM